VSNADIFLKHLDELSGGEEPEFIGITEPGAARPLHVMLYREFPWPGYITAFTYGVSTVPHPDWKNGTLELMICLRSTDDVWALALGDIANRLRGKCPFSYGNTINFGTQVSPDSNMSAFFVFAPLNMDPDSIKVEMPNSPLHIAQLYPIYQGEMKMIDDIGLEAFYKTPGLDFDDVGRPDLSAGR